MEVVIKHQFKFFSYVSRDSIKGEVELFVLLGNINESKVLSSCSTTKPNVFVDVSVYQSCNDKDGDRKRSCLRGFTCHPIQDYSGSI